MRSRPPLVAPGQAASDPAKSSLLAVPLSDVSHIIYGPYTDTFSKKSAHDRVDHRWVCFSLVLRESRTLDLAMEEESGLLSWLLGLQQLIVYFSPDKTNVSERWTLPKLQLQPTRWSGVDPERKLPTAHFAPEQPPAHAARRHSRSSDQIPHSPWPRGGADWCMRCFTSCLSTRK